MVDEDVVIDVVIGGKKYTVSRKSIIEKLSNLEPEEVRKYYVEIGSKKYPIKQVISEALNISKVRFTSMDAFRVLEKLRFEVKELKK